MKRRDFFRLPLALPVATAVPTITGPKTQELEQTELTPEVIAPEAEMLILDGVRCPLTTQEERWVQPITCIPEIPKEAVLMHCPIFGKWESGNGKVRFVTHFLRGAKTRLTYTAARSTRLIVVIRYTVPDPLKRVLELMHGCPSEYYGHITGPYYIDKGMDAHVDVPAILVEVS